MRMSRGPIRSTPCRLRAPTGRPCPGHRVSRTYALRNRPRGERSDGACMAVACRRNARARRVSVRPRRPPSKRPLARLPGRPATTAWPEAPQRRPATHAPSRSGSGRPQSCFNRSSRRPTRRRTQRRRKDCPSSRPAFLPHGQSPARPSKPLTTRRRSPSKTPGTCPRGSRIHSPSRRPGTRAKASIRSRCCRFARCCSAERPCAASRRPTRSTRASIIAASTGRQPANRLPTQL